MEANSNRRPVLVVYLSRFAFSLCPRRVFVKNASCFRRVSLTLFQNKGYHEFPSKKNAPFRGKFQGHLIMREIGSVADYLDVGGIVEGESATSHIRRFIMQRAQSLLISGASITETAEQLGFNYPQHFTRQFKNHYGITPSEFIRK